jgi:hypothetical protein
MWETNRANFHKMLGFESQDAPCLSRTPTIRPEAPTGPGRYRPERAIAHYRSGSGRPEQGDQPMASEPKEDRRVAWGFFTDKNGVVRPLCGKPKDRGVPPKR